MITLKNINKSYNNTKVLKNINLTLPDKGLICILGASGSGKSTLLNIIGKIEVPDKGEVYFYNKNIKDIKSEMYHTHYVSFIYQNYNLIDALSVKDNLNLITKNNEWIINKLGLSKIKNIKTNKISGGEKQRTAIARSILSDSLVYLADEPTGAIDTANSIKIMQILKELSKEKLVLMITHNEDLAHAYADEIIYLKDGTINKGKPTKECHTYKEIFKNKRKLSFKDIFKISMGYLKEQKIRSILTILATTIGLTSLTIVLGINNGLNEEIKSLEKARWIMGFLLEAGLLEETQYLHVKATPLGMKLSEELPLMGSEFAEQNYDDVEDVRDNIKDHSDIALVPSNALFDALCVSAKDPTAEGKASGVAFEENIASVFRFMGFDANRIGGSGNTDVVVRWKEDDGKTITAIVDGKSKSSGTVTHSDISDVAIETHKEKNNAEYVAIVGPGFCGDTIKEHARKKGFALITDSELINIALQAQVLGLSLTEVSLLSESKHLFPPLREVQK